MDTEDMIELIIQERLSFYFKNNYEPRTEQLQKSIEFLGLLEEKAPELTEEFSSYLDWIALHSGNEQEGIYLFGLHDDIRLMRDIISTV